MSSVKGAIESALEAGKAALVTYGAQAQEWMVVEEMAELLLALARRKRGRGSSPEVVEEAADAIIMALQIGLYYGGESNLAEAINLKVARLRGRLDALTGKS
jgi:hypothetical protein